jgi:uncharacterized protein
MSSTKTVRLPLEGDGWLMGDVSLREYGKPAVLFIHGFGSVRQGEKALALQAACTRRGWNFAAFDFRGHGESSGSLLAMRPSGLLADLDAIRLYLQSRGVSQIFPVGSSMGGWAASWFTLTHPDIVPACVLLAPAFFWLTSRWSKLSEAERRAWKTTGRHAVKTDWIEAELSYGVIEEIDCYPCDQLLAGWRTPLTIFHGMQDTVIPYAQTIFFAEQTKYPGIEVRLLKDGDHRLTAHKELIAEGACEFFGWANRLR